MLTPAGSRGAGRLRFDPTTRRRVRRAGARARPLVLPVAVVLAALIAAGARGAEVVTVVAPVPPDVPAGLVLVSVQPGDPAVLPLAVPGSRVDVYAAAGIGSFDPVGETVTASADLVVRGALVVAPAGTAGSPGVLGGPAAQGGGLGAGLPAASGPGLDAPAITLVVTDEEAAALAARPGDSLLVAVRGSPRPAPQP